MKASKQQIFIFLAVFAGALISFSFLDLNISLALYNQSNGFGRFFEQFGEMPMLLVLSFCSAAMLVTREKTVKWKNALNVIFFGLFFLLSSAAIGILPSNYSDHFPVAIGVVVGLLIGVLFLFLAQKAAKHDAVTLRYAAKIGLLTCLAAVFVINLLKMIWGRPRLRSMNNPETEFTPWYQIQNFNTDNEFMSFPSGHSANAATIFWITTIPSFIPKLKEKRWEFTTVAFIWTIMVMVSRIIMGAHFASDVLVGATIGILSFYCVQRWQFHKMMTQTGRIA